MHIITNHGMECFAAKKYNYYGTSESIFNRVALLILKVWDYPVHQNASSIGLLLLILKVWDYPVHQNASLKAFDLKGFGL